MDRTVQRVFIDEWIDKNGPDGLFKFAQKAGVSANLISKVRVGYCPKKAFTRQRICDALKVKESDLFPAVSAAEKKSAS